jgi:uncharacterized protein (UPF0332 family)
MTLARDLLEQARFLAAREMTKPRQASLRRAASAAYYSVFHLLIDDATRLLAPGNPAGLRKLVRRSFTHADMKTVCKQFGSGSKAPPTATASLINAPIENEIITVAQIFVQLQEQRHQADYDVTASFTRFAALQIVQSAAQASRAWSKARSRPNARVFLAALLLQRQWNLLPPHSK